MLLRFDPFAAFDRELDRAVSKLDTTARTLPLDVTRRDGEFIVEIDMPGVRDSIDITVERNVLRVAAERAATRTEGDDRLVSERRHGLFARELYLGQGLDTERITAGYDDGVLRLVVPVAETSKPRKVAVSAGAGDDAVAIDAA